MPQSKGVQGLDTLLARLHTLGLIMQQKALTDIAVAGGTVVLNAARAAAPVETNAWAKHPGALKRGMTLDVRKSANLREALIVVGPDQQQFYSKFVEFGTKRMRARPWLGPALERSRGAALEAMRRALETYLATIT